MKSGSGNVAVLGGFEIQNCVRGILLIEIPIQLNDRPTGALPVMPGAPKSASNLQELSSKVGDFRCRHAFHTMYVCVAEAFRLATTVCARDVPSGSEHGLDSAAYHGLSTPLVIDHFSIARSGDRRSGWVGITRAQRCQARLAPYLGEGIS